MIVTQSMFTNGVFAALAVMAIIYASYPPKSNREYWAMIIGVIV